MECATRCARSLCAGCRSVFSPSWVVAWLCSLVALPRVCVPDGFSLHCRVYSALLLCWLPLLGACSRRCGSCRPPEVSFGLRSFWCVRFFLVLGCFLHCWPHLFACRSLLGFLPRSGGIDLILCLVGQILAWSALLAACVSYVLSVVVCFLHPGFCGVALFAGGPVPGSCSFFGLLSGTLCSAPWRGQEALTGGGCRLCSVFLGAGGGTRFCASWILVSLPYVFWVSVRNLAALS